MKITRQMVRDAFDPDVLKAICTAPEEAFEVYGKRTELVSDRDGRQRFYYHRNNESPVLGVAHLDSVCEDRRCDITETSAGLLVASPTLDDRLGAYVVLELLPQLGIEMDWLLTTGEEMGDSTAAEFESEHDYNWMFSFDRGGTDVVMYQYETPALVAKVEACSAVVGMGIFSDISVLDHLGCAGFNWGVGYRDYHGRRSHAWLEDTFRMVARFCRFYEANAHVELLNDDEYDLLDERDFCECGGFIDREGFCEYCDEDRLARIAAWRDSLV